MSTSAHWSTPTSVMVPPSLPLPSPSHSRHLEGCIQTLSLGSLPRHWPLSRRPPSAAILSFSRFLSRNSSRRAVRAELLTSVEAACCVGTALPRLFSRSPHKLTGKSSAARNQNPCSQNRTKIDLFVVQWGPIFVYCSHLLQLSFVRELHVHHNQRFLNDLVFCISAVPALQVLGWVCLRNSEYAK